MTSKVPTAINISEIASHAWLSWQKDGCPLGRDLHYWQDAEARIKATRQPMTAESKLKPNGSKGAKRLKSNGTRKTICVRKGRANLGAELQHLPTPNKY